MAFAYSPKIVTDGLVFAVDAANKKSYPGSGTTWSNLSRNGIDGTLVNTPTYSSNNLGTFSFNGTNEYVSIPANNTTNIQGSLTVGMFCKSNQSGWSIYWSGVSKYNQFILGPNAASGGKMAFLVYSNAWYPTNYASDVWGQSGLDLETYHYYVGTYNQSTGILSMYVDGIEEASFDIGSLTLSSDTGGFYIGKRDVSSHYLNFTLGVCQIYNKALSQTQILQNYNALKSRFGL